MVEKPLFKDMDSLLNMEFEGSENELRGSRTEDLEERNSWSMKEIGTKQFLGSDGSGYDILGLYDSGNTGSHGDSLGLF